MLILALSTLSGLHFVHIIATQQNKDAKHPAKYFLWYTFDHNFLPVCCDSWLQDNRTFWQLVQVEMSH